MFEFGKIWRYSQGQRDIIGLRIILGVAQVGLGLGIVWESKRFIDLAVRGQDISFTAILLMGLISGSIVIRQFSFYIETISERACINRTLQQTLDVILRRDVFGCKQIHSGDYVSRLTQDIPAVAKTICQTVPQTIITTIQLFGAFWLMRILDERIAWFLLIGTPLLIIGAKSFGNKLRKMTEAIRAQEAKIQGCCQEWIENTITLECLCCHDLLIGKMRGMQDGLFGLAKKRAGYTVIGRGIVSVCFGLGYMGVFVWGGYQLQEGNITFGAMVSFLQLVSQIQSPILSLMSAVPVFYHTAASIGRLQEVVDSPKRTEPTCNDKIADGELFFCNVSYHYPSSNSDIIRGFNKHIRQGSKVCISGMSGIGKTTIFRLILGIIQPTQGRIERGKGQIAYVPQGNTLVSGSIRDNLLLANPTASDDDLYNVLHTAAADFVFDLPNGLDTECAEKGGGLSEGMSQRIAVARGLLQPGSIILLDEVSSALDCETERIMYERILEVYSSKTIIAISHNKPVLQMFQEHIDL